MVLTKSSIVPPLILLAVSLTASGAIMAFKPMDTDTPRFSEAAQNARWGKNYLPNLPVFDQDGNRYEFYNDLIKGKKVIINFIFTTCTDICPLTTARMTLLQDKLGDMVGRQVQMYSITIDPEYDSPSVLKRYADAFGVRAGWRFLTGKPEDIKIIRDRLGERSRINSEHRHEMLLGNDAIGSWSKDSIYGDIDQVAMNIKGLDPTWRPSAVAGGQNADALLIEVKGNPGAALFAKACRSCHTVGDGDRAGPDLLDVEQKREITWLMRFITRPDRIMAEKDPVAIALMAKYPVVKMPNLGLSEADAKDVLAFIKGQSFAFHQAETAKLSAGARRADLEHAEHRHR